jgi:hypothetical protein
VTQLIDDQLLGAVLLGASAPGGRSGIHTTGHWYVRLCQAVIGAEDRTGVLSKPFASLATDAREHALNVLIELPEEIGLVSLRELAPIIGQLRRRHDLNILAMEALAAAVYLKAEVFLSAESPKLVAALEQEGRSVEIVR